MALQAGDDNSFGWAIGEIARACALSLMLSWGLWMLDAAVWRALAVGAIVGFMMLSGIAERRLEQLCLLFFGLGLMVCAHVPAVDHALSLALTWQPQHWLLATHR